MRFINFQKKEMIKMKNICYICGMELHKDSETKEMEKLFFEVWKDNNDKFGLNKPYHWHEVKKGD